MPMHCYLSLVLNIIIILCIFCRYFESGYKVTKIGVMVKIAYYFALKLSCGRLTAAMPFVSRVLAR